MVNRGAWFVFSMVLVVGCDDALGPIAAGSSGAGSGGLASGGSGPDAGGTSGAAPGGSANGGVATGCPLVPDATGWVQAVDPCRVQGAWYAYNDCNDSPGDCTTNHLPAEGSFPNTGGKMCTSGSTAMVNAATEYPTKWGAGIALNLNQAVGSDAKNPVGTLPVALTGFSFTLSGTAPGLRVNFPTPETATTAHFKTINATGAMTVLFREAAQGSWVTAPTTLDATRVEAIQFQIPSAMSGPIAFDFCIEALTALY